MKGVIAIANNRRGRYAALVDDGKYTTFVIVGLFRADEGEPVAGALSQRGLTTLVIDGRSADVLVEEVQVPLERARRWVEGTP